jgi:hypothetical protein
MNERKFFSAHQLRQFSVENRRFGDHLCVIRVDVRSNQNSSIFIPVSLDDVPCGIWID